MHYYKRHIGDYTRDTAHLSLLEHGVYARLLDVYYMREAPIPDDGAERLVGARSPAEKRAVRVVLAEFFRLQDGKWYQSRCEEELAADHAFIEQQRSKGKASAAARQHKSGSTSAQPESNRGSTAVQPRLDSGSTESQPPTPTPTPINSVRAAAPPSGAPPDPRKQLFDLGVSLLGESRRGLIGKAVAAVGEGKVAAVLGQMAVKPPVGDPADYFAKATQPRGFVA